jgi:2'-5' RNA ligase
MPRRPIAAEYRFFFALLPPIILARQIVHAMTPVARDGRMMQADRLHITLDILRDFPAWPGSVVTRLLEIGAAISAAPVEIVLDQASGGARSVALRPRRKNPLLEALYRDIASRRAQAGLVPMDRTFSPHMTLAYDTGMPASRPAGPFGWIAREFVLIHSHIGHTRHEVLGRWPLDGVHRGQLELF